MMVALLFQVGISSGSRKMPQSYTDLLYLFLPGVAAPNAQVGQPYQTSQPYLSSLVCISPNKQKRTQHVQFVTEY